MTEARRLKKPRLVVNAGGSSQRMGQPKALLSMPPHGQPLVLHIVDRLRHLAEPPVLLIANDPQIETLAKKQDDMHYVADAYPGAGPLGGLVTALSYCNEWVMVVACDMPLVKATVFGLLWQIGTTIKPESSYKEWDAVVPHVQGRWQPLHGLYHRRALPLLQAQFEAGERSIQRALCKLNVRSVTENEIRPFDPHFHSFINVNTPEEWRDVLISSNT